MTIATRNLAPYRYEFLGCGLISWVYGVGLWLILDCGLWMVLWWCWWWVLGGDVVVFFLCSFVVMGLCNFHWFFRWFLLQIWLDLGCDHGVWWLWWPVIWDILFVSYCAGVDGGRWSWWLVMVVLVNLWLLLNRKNEWERINNVLYSKWWWLRDILFYCVEILF